MRREVFSAEALIATLVISPDVTDIQMEASITTLGASEINEKFLRRGRTRARRTSVRLNRSRGNTESRLRRFLPPASMEGVLAFRWTTCEIEIEISTCACFSRLFSPYYVDIFFSHTRTSSPTALRATRRTTTLDVISTRLRGR